LLVKLINFVAQVVLLLADGALELRALILQQLIQFKILKERERYNKQVIGSKHCDDRGACMRASIHRRNCLL